MEGTLKMWQKHEAMEPFYLISHNIKIILRNSIPNNKTFHSKMF